MPCTLYHFGPSGFVGLIFKKYLDIPVFVLANVIVDIEVLFADKWPIHQYWRFHTLLVGAVVGTTLAIAAYPLRKPLKKIMQKIRLPYKTGFWKMIISGILGVWLHVLIDGIYHWDVLVFWPSRIRLLYNLLTQNQVKAVCIAFWIAAIVPYAIAARAYTKQNKAKNNSGAILRNTTKDE